MLKGVSVLFGILMILGVQGLDNDLFEDTVNMIEDCQDRPVTLCIKVSQKQKLQILTKNIKKNNFFLQNRNVP